MKGGGNKVQRYRKGKVPEYALKQLEQPKPPSQHKHIDEDDLLKAKKEKERKEKALKAKLEKEKEKLVQKYVQEPLDADAEDDDDFRVVGVSDTEEDMEERRARMVNQIGDGEEEEEEEYPDLLEDSLVLIGQKPINQIDRKNDQKIEKEGREDGGKDDVEEGGEEGEEEEEEEEEDYAATSLPYIPVFVPKEERSTIREREEKEAEEEENKKYIEERDAQRIDESKSLVAEEIQSLFESQKEEEEEMEVDDTDRMEEAKEEHEKWLIRERDRVIRDRSERNRYEIEKKEIEERRKLSDEQIIQLDSDKFNKEKKKQKFMQKYFHQGAYFQDDEIFRNRDFSAPTGADKSDISILPKIMQVKNFGKRGRTKYTHLVDNDTTDRSSGWADKNSEIWKRRKM